MINPVSVYKLTPEQMDNYKPGMYLGEPDRVYQPESLLQKGSKEPTVIPDQSRVSNPKRFHVSKKEYLELRKSGMSRTDICKQYKIKIDTLRHYLHNWGIGKPLQEAEAMKELSADE